MAIERADVMNTEGFKERRWLQELTNSGFECFHSLFSLFTDDWNVTQECFELALTSNIDRVEANLCEAA